MKTWGEGCEKRLHEGVHNLEGAYHGQRIILVGLNPLRAESAGVSNLLEYDTNVKATALPIN